MPWRWNFFNVLTTQHQQWRPLRRIYQKVDVWSLSIALSLRCFTRIFADFTGDFFYQLLVSFGFTLEHVVHALQVEIGELKGRLTEVISNCDALCRRIATEGPESLRSSIKPFAVAVATPENGSSSSSLQRVIQFQRNPPSETKLDWYFGPSFFFPPLSLYTFEIQVLTYWSHLFDSLFNVLGSKKATNGVIYKYWCWFTVIIPSSLTKHVWSNEKFLLPSYKGEERTIKMTRTSNK